MIQYVKMCKNIYNGKEKKNNCSKNCSKQIVWRELNRTVCFSSLIKNISVLFLKCFLLKN